MRRRQITTSGKDFIPVGKNKMDNIILPSIMEFRSNFEELQEKRDKLPEKIYLLLLKSFEEELSQTLIKYKNSEKSLDTEFLLVKIDKNQKEENLIGARSKFFYWKKFYNICYKLNGEIFAISFEQFENINKFIEKKKELIEEIKDVFKQCVKYNVHLKERSKTIDHNLKQFKALVDNKKGDLDDIEGEFLRKSTLKKKKSGIFSFFRNDK